MLFLILLILGAWRNGWAGAGWVLLGAFLGTLAGRIALGEDQTGMRTLGMIGALAALFFSW